MPLQNHWLGSMTWKGLGWCMMLHSVPTSIEDAGILSKAFEKSKRMIISVWSEFLATCIRSSYTISCVPHDRRARKSCCSSQRRWFRLKWSITVLYTYRLVVWWLMFLPMFIHVGTMFLPWHSSDIWPWSRESLDIFVIHGAMDSALCFKINAGISSGPVQSLE